MSNNANEIRDTDVISLTIIVWMKCASLLALFLTCITLKKKKFCHINKLLRDVIYSFILTFLCTSRRWYVPWRYTTNELCIEMHNFLSQSVDIIYSRMYTNGRFQSFLFSEQTFSQCFFFVFVFNFCKISRRGRWWIDKRRKRPTTSTSHWWSL